MKDEQEKETPQTEEVVVEPESTEEETPKESKDLQSALAQKDHFREKAEKAESERQELQDKLNKLTSKPQSSDVDALDFIKLGKKLQDYSDEEIDFATEHAKSKNPEAILKALDSEMVQLAIEAKRAKTEKERLTLKPTGTQAESEMPKSLKERLASASVADKEKILTEAGLYKSPRPRADRVDLGRGK